MCDWVAFKACDYYETLKCPLYPLTLFLAQNWHTACFPNYFFHNRIEWLWRVVWTAVTSTYYDVLHTLEEEGQLDISNTQPGQGPSHLHWRMEPSPTPQQLWQLGLLPQLLRGGVCKHILGWECWSTHLLFSVERTLIQAVHPLILHCKFMLTLLFEC